jgi:hypothetical protein
LSELKSAGVSTLEELEGLFDSLNKLKEKPKLPDHSWKLEMLEQ